MKRQLITIAALLVSASAFAAAAPETIATSLGEFALKPQSLRSNTILVEKNVVLPALCGEQGCRNGGVITLHDGAPLVLQSGTTHYPGVLKGMDVQVYLSSETADSLRDGRGGTITVGIAQGEKPYLAGPFNVPLLTYSTTSRDADARQASVNLDGVVGAGSCQITSGKDLKFTLTATQNELQQLGNNRKLIERKAIGFDCVNVSGIALSFSSASMKSNDPTVLYDDATGVGVTLGYDVAGKEKGDIRWDNKPVNLAVVNDALSVAIDLYARGGRVTPGNFSFTGVYNAEYF